MQSAVLEAQSLIQSANFSELDGVYTYNLPAEIIANSADNTSCLITHVKTDEDMAGNTDFYAIDRQIEVQIFYKLDIDDVEDFEIKLLKLFKSNYYDLVDNRGHTTDPDTNQLTATFYFEQMKLLN